MNALIDNENNEVIYIASSISFIGNTVVAFDESGNAELIFGNMDSPNSRIESIDKKPEDFCGRNYIYENNQLIKQ